MPGDADERWQKKVAQKLYSSETLLEDTGRVLAGIGARRILPTDVAAGAMRSREHWPVGFADARKGGDEIAARLR